MQQYQAPMNEFADKNSNASIVFTIVFSCTQSPPAQFHSHTQPPPVRHDLPMTMANSFKSIYSGGQHVLPYTVR